MTSSITLASIQTPFGRLVAGASPDGICLLEFTDTQRLEKQIKRLETCLSCKARYNDNPLLELLNTQLKEYFSARRTKFPDIPLDLRGTEFQCQAWQALQHIPYGETRSYQQQAQAINKPKAARAVASANRNNRICILVPCHRVIGKNGRMAGYGGGIWRKEYLLALEKRGNTG